MKFIRKNGRVIPLKDKEKEVNKSFKDGKLKHNEFDKNVVYKKMDAKSTIEQSFAMSAIVGVAGALAGIAGRSKSSVATGAAIGSTIGFLSGLSNNKRYDNKGTIEKLHKKAKSR